MSTANFCGHLSATGIDTRPVNDPSKVWRCDHCGLRWSDNAYENPDGDLRRAIEALIRPRLVRDSVSGLLSEVRKVHVRVRDIRAILDENVGGAG